MKSHLPDLLIKVKPEPLCFSDAKYLRSVYEI